MSYSIHLGDCRTVLTQMATCSVDADVCDPPYGISFMGAGWDHEVPGPDHWRAALRVLKPGAHLLAFGGTRTFHRLTCAIEDAGFEIRDCLQWIYGQGFPKSHNGPWGGTALKPAWEPIVLARKPLRGTVASNHAAFGTGGLNIDACRIATDWSDRSEAWKRSGHSAKPDAEKIAAPPGTGINCHPDGRWPSNVLLTHDSRCKRRGTMLVRSSNAPGKGQDPDARAWSDEGGWMRQPGAAAARLAELSRDGYEEVADWLCAEDCPVRILDQQSGASGAHSRASGQSLIGSGFSARGRQRRQPTFHADRGGASRFFYCAKAARNERGAGNNHPTVKPVALLRYLVRLVTPPGGIVLDQYMGSGSTGVAALSEGRSFVGIDLDSTNVATARARIRNVAPLLGASAEAAE